MDAFARLTRTKLAALGVAASLAIAGVSGYIGRATAPVPPAPVVEIAKAPAPLPQPTVQEKPIYPHDYNRILQAVLVSEGYDTYTNIAGDPGGPTKYGITIHDVRHYLNPKATAQDVRNLTLEQAQDIYRKHYWTPIGGDYLAAGLNYTVFDYSVNAGVSRALGALHDCNVSRPIAYTTVQMIKCVNDKRMAFQMGLGPSFNKFKRGWRNRILSVRKISLQMAGDGGPVKADLSMDLYSVPRIGLGKAYIGSTAEEVY